MPLKPKSRKQALALQSPAPSEAAVNPAAVPPPRQVVSLSALSAEYLTYFEVALPPVAGRQENDSATPHVRVRRLTAAEDAEVTLIVNRVLPLALGAGAGAGNPAAELTPEQREKLTRELEQAEVLARTLALTKAVPMITEAAAGAGLPAGDLNAAAKWLQGLLPEVVLATLYRAVIGASSSSQAARSVGFF